jgi:hypothetical protein
MTNPFSVICIINSNVIPNKLDGNVFNNLFSAIPHVPSEESFNMSAFPFFPFLGLKWKNISVRLISLRSLGLLMMSYSGEPILIDQRDDADGIETFIYK